ncbi:hypothetical protein ACFX2J_045734 [Malus domestica]
MTTAKSATRAFGPADRLVAHAKTNNIEKMMEKYEEMQATGIKPNQTILTMITSLSQYVLPLVNCIGSAFWPPFVLPFGVRRMENRMEPFDVVAV